MDAVAAMHVMGGDCCRNMLESNTAGETATTVHVTATTLVTLYVSEPAPGFLSLFLAYQSV